MAAHGYDAFVLSAAPIPQIAAVPGVASATPVQGTSGGTPACACFRPINSNYFTVFEVAPKDLLRMVKLLAGRMPNQSDPDQVLASFTLQQDAGVHLGTVIRVPSYSASQRGAVFSGANVKPAGPKVDAVPLPVPLADGLRSWQELVLPIIGRGLADEDFTASPGWPMTTPWA